MWGCVYMATLCYIIRRIFIWHNVHIDDCLNHICYVRNCQQYLEISRIVRICVIAHSHSDVYNCTRVTNVLTTIVVIRMWYSYTIIQCMFEWKCNCIMDITLGHASLGICPHTIGTWTILHMYNIKSYRLGILYVCVNGLIIYTGFPIMIITLHILMIRLRDYKRQI